MKPFFILIFLFFVGHLFAQNVTYAYDSAGNRTSRVISLLRSDTSESSSEGTTFFEDVLSERTIKIYPNPTKGQFSVEITDISSDTNGKISLYDSGGRLIREQSALSGLMDFNLSNHSSGIYILRITIDRETTTWKIIKE